MKYRRPSNQRRGAWTYFFEFLIIIAGISVSFLLNEWREGKKMEEKKVSLLQEISNDLANDSLQLSFSVKYYGLMLNAHDSLLNNLDKSFHSDSLDMYLDFVSSYFPFQETKSTFLKITNDPELVISQEDTLLEYFLAIHNQLYPHIHEWVSVDKGFVLQQVLPYMDLHAPFYYPPPENKSFQGKVFYDLKEENAFLNLLKSGRTFKSAIAQVYSSALRTVVYRKRQIDEHLASLNSK